MVRRAMALLATGVAVGVVVDRVALELQKPAPEQFPVLRKVVNERVNPWLLERGYPGSEHAEIGTLEHAGRTTGAIHFTPVHPTIREDIALRPGPARRRVAVGPERAPPRPRPPPAPRRAV